MCCRHQWIKLVKTVSVQERGLQKTSSTLSVSCFCNVLSESRVTKWREENKANGVRDSLWIMGLFTHTHIHISLPSVVFFKAHFGLSFQKIKTVLQSPFAFFFPAENHQWVTKHQQSTLILYMRKSSEPLKHPSVEVAGKAVQIPISQKSFSSVKAYTFV